MAPPINPARKRSTCGFTRAADTIGDGTGERNVIGIQTEPLMLTSGPNEILSVTRVIVYIQDIQPVKVENYGGLNTPLTNGITIHIQHATGPETREVTAPGMPIKSNGDWALYGGDVRTLLLGGQNAMVVKWEKSAPLILGKGETIVINFDDDFTGLTKHLFVFQGSREYW